MTDSQLATVVDAIVAPTVYDPTAAPDRHPTRLPMEHLLARVVCTPGDADGRAGLATSPQSLPWRGVPTPNRMPLAVAYQPPEQLDRHLRPRTGRVFATVGGGVRAGNG